jgi:hypothetical protein
MISRWTDLFFLYWPAIGAAFFLLVLLFPQTVFEKSGLVRVSLFDFISIEHGLHKGIIRMLAFTMTLVFLAIPAFRDYSRFFPESLRLAVFFDVPGIERVIKTLSQEDLAKLSLRPGWQERRKIYLANINVELEAVGIPFRFRDEQGQTSATGELKFRTQSIDRWGAQLYRIIEAKGSLVHTTQAFGEDPYRLFSEFELVNTEANNIEASFSDVYWNHGILIMPVFKQLYRVSPSREIYHHALIAATRIDIFPYINIGNTIYLFPENGSNVPIAYATHSLP